MHALNENIMRNIKSEKLTRTGKANIWITNVMYQITENNSIFVNIMLFHFL